MLLLQAAVTDHGLAHDRQPTIAVPLMQ